MAKRDVDKKRVRVASQPAADSAVKCLDDVYIVVTQAFCPKGHNLVEYSSETFDGYPGVTLFLESEGRSGEVVLSPFHGDDTKRGLTDWAKGASLSLHCPVCKERFPKLANCRCPGKGELVMLYLTPSLKESHVLAVCNVWGCRRSRTIDNWQIISEYLEGQIE